MNYLKLLNARRGSRQQPTMEPLRLSREQMRLADEGCCIDCGASNQGSNSYLCKDCQSKETMEDIRSEIAALRRKLLKKP